MKVSSIGLRPNKMQTKSSQAGEIRGENIGNPRHSFTNASYSLNFKGALNKLPFLEVRDIQLPCPCCGIKMIPQWAFSSISFMFKDKTHLQPQKCTGIMVDFLNPFESRMHKPEQEYFKKLRKLSKSNPELTLKELLILMQKGFNLVHLRISSDIHKIAIKEGIEEGILVKETARRLVQPSLGTMEHLRPESRGGHSVEANYFTDCYQCNQERGTLPIDAWVRKNPKMPGNIKRHFDHLIALTNAKKVVYDGDYFHSVAKTLETESNGLVKIDTSKLKTYEELYPDKPFGIFSEASAYA